MSDKIQLGNGPSETVLPEAPEDMRRAILAARESGRAEIASVVAKYPAHPDVWAELAESAHEPIEIYAFARVGYHRGLDALRAAGWRGSGYVRWDALSNRGFLTCLDILRQQAEVIGESAEAQRCALFLKQLDPNWSQTNRA